MVMVGRRSRGVSKPRTQPARAGLLLALGGSLALLAAGQAAYPAGPSARRLQVPPPVPASMRIPVDPLGFRAPSRFYLTFRVPSATLDFVDDTHLLFTFHQSALMHREEAEPEDDEDQTIAAVLLELPTGKVVERTSWRLHDKGRYLWPMGRGRFLVRERNTLYLLDKPGARLLTERTSYFKAGGTLLAVQLSPDSDRLMVQYEEPAAPAKEGEAAAPTLGDGAPKRSRRVRLLLIDTAESTVSKTSTLQHAVALPLVKDGYLEVQQASKAKQWNVLLTPFGGESRVVTQLTSTCEPELQPLHEEVFLAQLCMPYTTDHLMQAYSLDGKKLWEQQWESRYVWGNYTISGDGSRFAYESLELDHPIATLDPIAETSITGQPIGVYDTANGELRMVSTADPILSAGQNYALSPDGDRFAVLRDGAIEVYKLPPAAVR